MESLEPMVQIFSQAPIVAIFVWYAVKMSREVQASNEKIASIHSESMKTIAESVKDIASKVQNFGQELNVHMTEARSYWAKGSKQRKR